MKSRVPHKPDAKRIRRVTLAFLLGLFVAWRGFGVLSPDKDGPSLPGAMAHVTRTNGFTIRWEQKLAASNSPFDLVLVHGTPGEADVWASQFTSGLTNANLFAYNRPGFGGSLPVLAQPHLQTQADALMTLLACATTNRVLAIGHSYGSPIALLAALEHPDKIAGVLLIGGDVDPAQEKPWLVQYLFGWRITSWVLPHALRQCNRELLTVRGDLAQMQTRLSRLSVPVVMLHGQKDPLVPVANVAWLERQLAKAGKSNLFAKILLPEANHFIPWQHPGEVERAVRLLQDMASHPVSNARD